MIRLAYSEKMVLISLFWISLVHLVWKRVKDCPKPKKLILLLKYNSLGQLFLVLKQMNNNWQAGKIIKWLKVLSMRRQFM